MAAGAAGQVGATAALLVAMRRSGFAVASGFKSGFCLDIGGNLPNNGTPVQIYSWITQSREEFEPLASAAIVILLVMLLIMNSLAIFLRNKFQKRW